MLKQWQLAEMAQAAYTQPADVTTAYGAMAMIREVGGEFVVVCPGTHLNDGQQTVLDVIRDIDAWPVWRKRQGFCHKGFAAGGAALWQRIGPMIPPGKRAVFAGHSMGAAFALYLAAENAAAGFNACRVAAFAPPRVGAEPFGHHVRQASEVCAWRYGDDPVPLVPSAPPFPFWQPIKLGMIGCPLMNPIDAHAIGGYVASLKARNI